MHDPDKQVPHPCPAPLHDPVQENPSPTQGLEQEDPALLAFSPNMAPEPQHPGDDWGLQELADFFGEA